MNDQLPTTDDAVTTAAPAADHPARQLFDRIVAEVGRVFLGQDELVLGTLVALFSNGHVLIESVPGLGKTLFVRTLGRVLGCQFGRIQFTPDLMPSDITGAPIFDMRTQEFRFRPGPVFTQLLLADEINRSPAKTHAALLEIMQERRVTVEGIGHGIQRPFLVLATQNPIESEGTYNLPEAQLDRFMFKLVIEYPSAAEEAAVLAMHGLQTDVDERLGQLAVVTGPEEIVEFTGRCGQVFVDPKLIDYVNALVRQTRQWPQFHLGASTRAGLALMQGIRTLAAFRGREYAVPDDVVELALPVLRHRVILSAEAEVEGHNADQLLREMIRTVEVPQLSSAPVLLLSLVAAVGVPLGLLARLAGIFPARRLVWLAVLPGLAALGLIASPVVLWAVLAVDGLLLLAAAADLFSLPGRRTFSASRETLRVASVRKPHAVALTLDNCGTRSHTLAVRDGVPQALHPEPAEFTLTLAGPGRAVLRYALRPARRGAFFLPAVHLKLRSRWGLWQRLLRVPVDTPLHVYPDLRQLAQYALLARTNRLSLLGVRRVRRVGQDHDFERLRDYNLDDNYKHIDWRSTAKRNRLTVKDFQSTQSQRIVFLLDCGRMMTNVAAGLSLLDHALNAMLMLSYVALRQGDSVGLIAFSDEIHTFVPPRSAMPHMNRLLHACFDRFPRLVESRYDQAFRYLAGHCRRRSLVILVTNVIDEVNAGQVDRHLANLAGRHLPLGVLLRDRTLYKLAEAEQPQGAALWQAAAACDILTWRRQVLSDLTRQGVLALDLFPEDMTAPLINQYLQIKARHLL